MVFKTVFPGLSQLINYKRSDLTGDLSAGLIVGVMLIPQGMAYAMLTGVHPVMGLYAVTIPLFVYCLFASSRHLSVGPVAMGALIAFTGVSGLAQPGSDQYVNYIILLTLMVGVFRFLVGVLRLGFLVNFLSAAVISGFTSAAAFVIGLSQMNHLLGIELGSYSYNYQLIYEIVHNVTNVHWLTLAIGLGSIVLLVLLRQWVPRLPGPIIVVTLSILVVHVFGLEAHGVRIVGDIPRGIPAFSLPSFNLEHMVQLLPIALTIAFVNFMESTSIAKVIAWKEKYKINPNQEERAIGLANMLGSFFSSIPVTGSYSRTAANYQYGGKTVLSSLVTVLLITLTLLFLTPLFYAMPTAVLASVIIVAVYHLINLQEIKRLFTVKKADGWTALIAFLVTLLIDIVTGIVAGVLFSILVFIWRSAYPHIAELGYLEEQKIFRNVKRYPGAKTFPGVLIIRIDARLYFANMGFLEEKLAELIAKRESVQWVIIDMSAVNDIDAVALDLLAEWIVNYKARGISVLLAGVKGPVRDIMAQAGWTERFGEGVNYLSLQHALRQIGYLNESAL
jgi:SulP family sulfate permease